MQTSDFWNLDWYGDWGQVMQPKSKEAFLKAAQEASDFYSETTKAENQSLINMFKAKGVKFVDPGKTVEQMREMTAPIAKQLPEVEIWAKRLSGR